MKSKTVVILSIGSDIGAFIARQYLQRGWKVVGTYRNRAHVKEFVGRRDCALIPCDLSDKKSIANFIVRYKKLRQPWDVFISAAGDVLPARAFFNCDFDDWAQSVNVNAIAQLRVLHALHPLRRRGGVARVVLFAGGAMNNSVTNLSAYTISKIMLAKMTDFLDAENKDLSIVIVGPGFTRTKIHDQFFTKNAAVARSKLESARKDLKDRPGTPLLDIFECIDWLVSSEKKVVSGRNFSVVYDPWRTPTRAKLIKALKADPDMYKLKRHGNRIKL